MHAKVTQLIENFSFNGESHMLKRENGVLLLAENVCNISTETGETL